MGHAQIIAEALEQVDELIVGIGSAERSYTENNPFTAGERMEMVLRFSGDRTIPVPIRDINRYSVWVSHVTSLVPSFDVVFSNNPLTIKLFEEASVEVRSTKLVERSRFSGTYVRKVMLEGGDWSKLVPDPVKKFILEIDGVSRMKEIYGSSVSR